MMLPDIVCRNPGVPIAQPCSARAPLAIAEFQKKLARLKTNKAADDVGLVAEFLHHSPEVMAEALLQLGTFDWRGAGNMETNHFQHFAGNQGSKINIRITGNCSGHDIIHDIWGCPRACRSCLIGDG